jgi:hypothetical protein
LGIPTYARQPTFTLTRLLGQIEALHLALEEAIYGDLLQVVPRFGKWNNNSAPD